MADGMIYSAVFTRVTVSAAQDFFELNTPSGKSIRLLGVFIGQNSEEGDAASESLSIDFIVDYSTSGSGGSAPTPRALDRSNTVAAGTTVEVNNTTQATGGSPLTLLSDAWNLQAGFQWVATPEMQIKLGPSSRFVVASPDTPADAVTMSGTIVWMEL